MNKEQAKKGGFERTAVFFEKLNYGIGAIALAGAVAFESTTLAVFGALQFAEGAVWNWIKNRVSKKPKPSLAPA